MQFLNRMGATSFVKVGVAGVCPAAPADMSTTASAVHRETAASPAAIRRALIEETSKGDEDPTLRQVVRTSILAS